MKNIRTKYSGFWICLVITLLTAAVYYQVHSYEFINYDDTVYVYENPNIQNGLTFKAVVWTFSNGYAANWHPLTMVSHMLDWQLYGINAGGHHITNIIFHIANILLLFLVLKRMTGVLWQSAFVAALFALHPLHIQSVAWIAERKDVLSTFFWFLTMWAYVRFAARPKITNYLLIILFFALGLMSKAMLVTLPFVLLLLDYWPLGRLGTKRSLRYLIIEKVPLFVMVILFSIVTFIYQKKAGALEMVNDSGFPLRLANASISYLQYIIKMIWPANLSIFYPHPGRNVSILYAVISAVVLLAVTISILLFAKSRKYLVTGWLWYLGTLVPVIGLVQFSDHSMADRFSYITLTGLFIIIAWGIPELLAKWRYKKIILALLAVSIVSVMSGYTYFQICYWQNSETLFRHALAVTKDNYLAHFYIAVSLRDRDKLDEAAEEYQKCLQIKPDQYFAFNGLGIISGKRNDFVNAGEYFTEALRINPKFAEARTNLGYVLTIQGKFDDAETNLNESLRLNPYSATTHYHLGRVLAQKGKIEQAVMHFEQSLRIQPDWVEPMNELAWYLAASEDTAIRNPDRAVKLANRACELTDYKNPQFLDTLSVAYAAAGAFDKAVETAQKALNLCHQPLEQEQINNRLILFKAGKPYRSP